MEKIYTDVADIILERGAFKFGAFKLKLHEKNPNAPLSPFYHQATPRILQVHRKN